MRVGLIGLGLVGSELVKRFVAAGFDVVGYDVESDKVTSAEGDGMRRASSPAQVATLCRRIVLSLPNSTVVNEVVEGVGGIIESAVAGDTIIDTTTADPVESAALAGRLSERGIAFLDATILGSSRQVGEGDALAIVGGDAEVLARCDDILSAFSREVFHVGPNGKGAEAKLVVNLVLGLNRLVLAEGLVLGKKAGIDPVRLLDVLKAGAAYSSVMDTKGHKMVDGEFSTEARLSQHLKDVGLILELGARTGTTLPLSALHAQLLQAAESLGFGDQDNSAIIKVLEQMA
jgi:3-hydroxyisobutyrate dehydrogenase-like beta-hydroxyacid dehydrogenase